MNQSLSLNFSISISINADYQLKVLNSHSLEDNKKPKWSKNMDTPQKNFS